MIPCHLSRLGRHMQRRVLQPAPGLQGGPGVQQDPEHLEVTHASRQVQVLLLQFKSDLHFFFSLGFACKNDDDNHNNNENNNINNNDSLSNHN